MLLKPEIALYSTAIVINISCLDVNNSRNDCKDEFNVSFNQSTIYSNPFVREVKWNMPDSQSILSNMVLFFGTYIQRVEKFV